MMAALPKYAVEVILLAAGLSSRMGGINKLLIGVNGAPLVRRMKADNTSPACRRFTREHPELTRVFIAQNDHFTTDMDTPEDAQRLGIRLTPKQHDQGGTPNYENNR